jgi:large subunit ribosomal protein L15
MQLSDLQPAVGSRRKRKRVGRGISAGQGKTAGRGSAGYGARAGNGGALHLEGGNLPFVRKLPFKRGFNNINKIQYAEVNLTDLQLQFTAGAEVSPESLAEKGFFKKPTDAPVVVLGNGKLTKPLMLRVHRISAAARAQVEAVGGSVEILPLP